MAGGVDRISALPDDLIQRILRFAPANEAASTALLSARWRSLWRSTGAVNLAVRLPEPDDGRRHGHRVSHDAVSSCHDAFVRSAQAALSAASAAAGGRGRHVTRLTLDLRAATMDVIDRFVHTERPLGADAAPAPDTDVWLRLSDDVEREADRWVKRGDVVRDVVSHPAARRVEELRVSASAPAVDDDDDDGEVGRLVGVFHLDLRYVPSETLRVLDLTRCSGLRMPPAVETPRLTTLRLQACAVNVNDLQRVIDAAPALATVHLDSVSFDGMEHGCYRLRLPAATTALVLARCRTDAEPYRYRRSGRPLGTSSVEIDAPGLRSFRYAGYARRFSLASPPDMARADLHFFHVMYASASTSRDLFWRFLRSFRGVRSLKLKVSDLKHVRYGRDLLRARQQADLAESLDRFARRRRRKPNPPPPPPPPTPVNSTDEHLSIVGLSGRSFACLKNSLRRFAIQFRMDQPNCIGVKLIKFFAENAIHLEEMRIDGGNQRMHDHINHMVERWISDSSAAKKRANHEISSEGSCDVSVVDSKHGIEASTPRFRLLPLERR
uniref:F-box domain-containing protein n=1 Tax=Oryza rufipogon TaxID=4529 RepID=A0A0E0R9D9_ORYRU